MEHLILIGSLAGAVMALVAVGTWVAKVFQKAMRPIRELQESVGKAMAELELHNSATMASLKYSISRAHREYMADGKIDRYALECVVEMHNRYVALGGNGFVKSFINELEQLPFDMTGHKI